MPYWTLLGEAGWIYIYIGLYQWEFEASRPPWRGGASKTHVQYSSVGHSTLLLLLSNMLRLFSGRQRNYRAVPALRLLTLWYMNDALEDPTDLRTT